MKKKVFVFDASAFINFFSLNQENDIFTTGKVLRELKSFEKRLEAENMAKTGLLKIIDPEKKFLQKALTESKKLGFELSETDLSIVGLALELNEKKFNPVIVTDDYALQNLLMHFKKKFVGVHFSKIKKMVVLKLKCRGCGREYQQNLKKCIFCKSPLFKKKVYFSSSCKE